jgi:glycosyltransferase involved in cell wall biosynthesis
MARVLIIAEAANPEWVSVPLEGWSHARALAEVVDAHVVTHARNREAIERAGWREGKEFTTIDSDLVARPLSALGEKLRERGLGWTVETALAAPPYYYFEHLVWRRFGADIVAGKYDVVHRLTPLTPTTPSLIAQRCRRANVPFVWGPVNGGLSWPAAFSAVRRREGEWLSYVREAYKLLPYYRSTRRNATAIVVGSVATWDQLDGYHDRCVYIPENGIDPDRFQRIAQPAVAGAPLRVAFVGRLVPYKGADMLLEAAAPLVRAGKIHVDVMGDGTEMGRLKALAAAQGIEGGVQLDGWVDHSRLQERLSRAQVFGFPSVREFGGAVVIEAMALGLAPLVVDYGGPAEHVTEKTGIAVPLGSRPKVVRAVRAGLERLAARPALATEVGRRARERVMSRMTWKAKALQVRQVYDWARGAGDRPDFGMPFPD